MEDGTPPFGLDGVDVGNMMESIDFIAEFLGPVSTHRTTLEQGRGSDPLGRRGNRTPAQREATSPPRGCTVFGVPAFQEQESSQGTARICGPPLLVITSSTMP